MPSQTSLSTPIPSLAPFPPVPLELQAYILSFCDAPTLAAASRCSLAFLELASPILYQDVEIDGMKQLALLLCAMPDDPQPHLSQHISLTRMRNFKYRQGDDVMDEEEIAARNRLRTPTRLMSSPPLLLVEIVLIINGYPAWERLKNRRIPLSASDIVPALLSFMNPRRLVFRKEENVAETFALRQLFLPNGAVSNWTRIEELRFDHAFTASNLFAVVAHTTGAPLSIQYDVWRLKTTSGAFSILLEDLRGEEEGEPIPDLGQLAKRVRKISVTVGSGAQRQAVLDGIQGSPLLGKITVSVRGA